MVLGNEQVAEPVPVVGRDPGQGLVAEQEPALVLEEAGIRWFPGSGDTGRL
jgi:hypothetical protein